MRYTPELELEQRITRLQDSLKYSGIDGAIIVQNADLFYFSGTIQRSHLFVPAEGEPILLVKKDLERAKKESALKNITGLESLKEIKTVLQSYGYGSFDLIGFELDVLPAEQYLRFQKLFEPARITNIGPLIRNLRMIKSPYEIEIFRDITKHHHEIFSFIRNNLQEGISECEMNGKITGISQKKGHSGLMRIRGFNQDLFYVHFLSGRNTTPSYFEGSVGGKGVSPAFAQGSSTKLIGRNEPVLVDYSFNLDGYMLDQTRIFCIGTLPDHLVEAHKTAIDILRELETMSAPGLSCSKLYDRAVELAAKSPYEKHFLGFPKPVNFVGHGIGIELDELPVIASGFNSPLQTGMVFALEPKFVFPDGAVGVENTYLLTEKGLESLTTFEEDIIYT